MTLSLGEVVCIYDDEFPPSLERINLDSLLEDYLELTFEE